MGIMGRDSLLKIINEKEAALKEFAEKYKDPPSIKYDLFYENGENAGFMEYRPKDDKVIIATAGSVEISGTVLKSLRDAINKLLDQ